MIYLNNKIRKSFYFHPTTPWEIIKIINCFSSNKSSGPNRLPTPITLITPYSFLDKNNLIFKQQLGFSFRFVCSVFIDLEIAFDSLDQHFFYTKIYHYDIRGLTHNWFRSYLSNWEQFLFISNSSSELMSIKCGVPQWSTLAPLLFLLYINYLNFV